MFGAGYLIGTDVQGSIATIGRTKTLHNTADTL